MKKSCIALLITALVAVASPSVLATSAAASPSAARLSLPATTDAQTGAASIPDAPAPGPEEAWTPFSHVTRNADGTHTAQLYTVPTFHKEGGRWHKVDATLRDSNDADEPIAADDAIVPVRFGAKPSRVVRLRIDGKDVVLQAAGLDIAKPRRTNEEVVYKNVADDTDLTYRFSPGGIKESLVLKSKNAPRSFNFHLSDPDHKLGDVHRQADGSFRFSSTFADGLALALDRAVAYEKPAHENEAVGADPASARLDVEKAGDGFDLTIAVNPTWLKGKSFPIVLDPTITFPNGSGALANGYSSSGNGGNYAINTTDAYLYAGRTTSEVVRSFLKFDLSSIPWGSAIDSADFKIYKPGTACLSAGVTCDFDYTLEIHRLNSAWENQTWNTLAASTDGGILDWDVHSPYDVDNLQQYDLTAQTQRWVRGIDANNGVVLRVADEGQLSGPVWYSTRANNGLTPTLTINYRVNASHGAPPAAPPDLSKTGTHVGWTAPRPITGLSPRRDLYSAPDGTLMNWYANPTLGLAQRRYNGLGNAPAFDDLALQADQTLDYGPTLRSDITSDGANTIWAIGSLPSSASAVVTKWTRSGLRWNLQGTLPTSLPTPANDGGLAIYRDPRTGTIWVAYMLTIPGSPSKTHLHVASSTNGGSSFAGDVDAGTLSQLATGVVAAQFVAQPNNSVALILQDGPTLTYRNPPTTTGTAFIATVDGSSATATSWQAGSDSIGRFHIVFSTSAAGVVHRILAGGSWSESTLESGFHALSMASHGDGIWLATDESTVTNLRHWDSTTGWAAPFPFGTARGTPHIPEKIDAHYVPVMTDDGETFHYRAYDDIGPITSLVSPAEGSTLVGQVTLRASALDPGLGTNGVSRVDFFADRGSGFVGYLGSDTTPDGSNQYTVDWNTAELDNGFVPQPTGGRLWPEGAYRIYAVAYDKAGHSTESARPLMSLAVKDLGLHPYRPSLPIDMPHGLSADVNLYNGNLSLTQSDLSEPTAIGPLGLTRSYNSLETKDQKVGVGWALSADTEADLVMRELVDHVTDPVYPSGTIELIESDGTKHFYLADGKGGYTSAAEDQSTLSHNGDGSWTLSMIDGSRFDFRPDGKPSKLTLPETGNGQSFTYGYDAGGQLTSVAEPTGRTVTIEYANGHVYRLHDFNTARTWTYAYTGTDLTSVTDPLNLVTRFTYDGAHRLTSVTDPRNKLTFFDFDGSGRVYQVRKRLGSSDFETSIDYSNPSAPTVTNYRGNLVGCDATCRTFFTATYAMDASNRLIRVDKKLPSGTTVSKSIGWDEAAGLTGASHPRNLKTSESDFSGHITRYTYDEVGNQLTTTDPVGTVSRSFYDEGYGGLVAEYFPNKTFTPSAGYPLRRLDAQLNLAYSGCGTQGGSCTPDPSIPVVFSARWHGWVNVPTTGSWTFSTTSDDGVHLVLDGRTVIENWTDHPPTNDAAPPLTLAAGLHEISAEWFNGGGPAQFTLQWSGPGVATQVVPAASLVPGLGLLTSSTEPSGQRQTLAYDSPFRRHKLSESEVNTDADGAQTVVTTTYGYTDPSTGQLDAYGRLRKKTLPEGNAGGSPSAAATTIYGYYAVGASATDPCTGGSANQGAMLQSKTFGNANLITAETSTYDDRGNVVASTDGKGTTCATFDADNRQVSVKAPDRASATTYAYDNDSNKTQVADPVAGTSTYAFDDLNRLTSTTDVFGGTPTTYGYDAFSPTTETTSKTDAAGVTTSDADQLARVVAIDYTPTGKPTDHYAFSYSADDDLLQTTYPTGATAARAYDTLHRMTSLQNHTSAGQAIADYTDSYDTSSRKTTENTRDGQWAYRYDSMGRLERVHDPKGFVRRYRFDRNTNRTQGEQDAGLDWTRGTALFDTNAADTPVAITDLANGSASVALPFTFPFYGQGRGALFASANGYLTLAANTSPQPDILTTPGVFPYAKDLKIPATGGVYTRRIPTSPLQPATAFLIRWKVQIPSAAGTDTTSYEQFGVWLYPDGHMNFVYGQMADGGFGARVGYSNGDGLNFANVGGLDLGQVVTNAPSVDISPHGFAVLGASTYDAVDRVTPDATHVFDAAGNMTRLGNATFGYDGRNLLTSTSKGSSATGFAYDGEGREVTNTVGATGSTLVTAGVGLTNAPSGSAFFDQTVNVALNPGDTLRLSSTADGSGATNVDDEIRLDVTRPDTTVATWTNRYNDPACTFLTPLPPKDLTSSPLGLTQPGLNQVRVRLNNICGPAGASNGPIYLVAGGSVTRLRYGSPGDSGATYETDTAGSVVVSHLAG
ncbi:MAG TPA: PA14 domain-containing protein, partial [Acidimicrobiales bacterium]|nr:PA14 domain-containing protein [Acidimicrobiales bacterium]